MAGVAITIVIIAMAVVIIRCLNGSIGSFNNGKSSSWSTLEGNGSTGGRSVGGRVGGSYSGGFWARCQPIISSLQYVDSIGKDGKIRR